MHVDSGWVVDSQTLEEVFLVSGINEVRKEYDESVKDDQTQANARLVLVLQFAWKAACNMGLQDFMQLDDVLKPKKEPGEVSWTLGPELYSET